MSPPLFIASILTGINIVKLLLWVGLAVLSVVMLVLTRKQWRHTTPLTKCVALSIVVHIMFLVYAYGTRLVYDHSPGFGPGGIIHLNIAAATDAADDEDSPRETKPWEQSVTDSSEVPVAVPSADRETVSIAPPTRANPPPLLVSNPPPRDTQPVTEPRRELPIPALIKPHVVAQIEPTPVEAPDAPRPGNVDAPNGSPDGRERATTPDEVVVEIPPPNSDISPDAKPPPPVVNVARTTDSPIETNDAAATPAVEPVRAADGVAVPKPYQHRAAASRFQFAIQFGGSPDTEAAVKAALEWLAANQSADGRWDADAFGAGREAKVLGHDRGGAGADADTGITGLALLAFLAGGHTHLEGERRECVQHGLEFLLRSQRSDGSLAGQAEMFARMYCHGMATLALGEAYALTDDERIRPYLEKAVQFTLAAQNRTTGGWRYQPGDTGDLSQFGWQLMALKSAELGGIEIPAASRAGMVRFLDSVSSGKHRGLASYRTGERATRTMTAEALACRLFLGNQDPAATREAAAFISQELPSAKGENLYYWYYASVGLFQLQDENWTQWNAALQKQLLTSQHRSGKLAGTWDPDRVWGHYGGRVYSTAMGALCLEVYYRYLPVYGPAPAPASR